MARCDEIVRGRPVVYCSSECVFCVYLCFCCLVSDARRVTPVASLVRDFESERQEMDTMRRQCIIFVACAMLRAENQSGSWRVSVARAPHSLPVLTHDDIKLFI